MYRVFLRGAGEVHVTGARRYGSETDGRGIDFAIDSQHFDLDVLKRFNRSLAPEPEQVNA
jgi:hypothetical protein